MQIIGKTAKAATLAAVVTFAGLLPAGLALATPTDRLLVAVAMPGIQVPSDDQLVALADRAMRAFMTSVREKSMQTLWNHISPRFQEKYSVAQLDEAFREFFTLPITGDPLAGKMPIFSSDPQLQTGGNLVVDGFYATTPSRLSFHLVFGMEGRNWKLVGINVSAKPVSEPVPDLRPL
jgi:hypothetical protein